MASPLEQSVESFVTEVFENETLTLEQKREFVRQALLSLAGGSMRDVQALARHANLQTTQRYVEENSEAQKQVVEMLL